MPSKFITTTTINVTCKTCGHFLEVELKEDNLWVEPCSSCLKNETVRIMRQFADQMEEKKKSG